MLTILMTWIHLKLRLIGSKTALVAVTAIALFCVKTFALLKRIVLV